MDYTARIERLREEARAEAKAAREICEKAEAENRDFTPNEKAAFDQHMAKGRSALDAAQAVKADRSILKQARDLANEIGEPLKPGQSASSSAGGRRKGGRTSPWSKDVAGRMARTMIQDVDGQKAVVSGSIGVPTPIETDIVAMSSGPASLLELIPVRLLAGGFGTGNSFSFLKQTVRTNNAAPVADGALKPTSVYTIEEVEDRVRVLAHLSEPVPERYFADHQNLEDFLRTEMEMGIRAELESQVVAGDGTGENLTGILETSGVISQAFATDKLTSIRKALTSLQVYGMTPTALVLNPTDLESLDLLRVDGATGAFLLGDPAGDEAANIWRVPRVPSTAVPAGTALLADFTQAEVIVREDATLAADRSGENFTKNLVTLRVEGRFGFAVKRPNAFAVIDLTA
jgi:HK97 family phage major capsid protein